MSVDLNEKLARLKAKRQAVEEAISALHRLETEYRDPVPARRSVQSIKPVQSRRIA